MAPKLLIFYATTKRSKGKDMQIHSSQTKNIPGKPFARSPSGSHSSGFRVLLADSLKSKESLDGVRVADSKTGLVCLGKITRKLPTVSDLIYATDYKKDCWTILANRANNGKPFKSIAPGTEVFLDPEKMEIVWNISGYKKIKVDQSRKIKSAPKIEKTDLIDPKEPFNGGDDRLTTSVRRFLGKKYSQMDCYELLVGGLKGMGIQYQGKGGLENHLKEKAVNRGFARNHYLNGEGIVAATGKKLYEKRIFKIHNADFEADKAILEMAPILKDGQILSFSTRTHGHTGVISMVDNVWTFINSGKMDNNLSGINGKMGVGEETLKEEIRNWFRLAQRHGDGLILSIGSMDVEKLSQFGLNKGGFTEKV